MEPRLYIQYKTQLAYMKFIWIIGLYEKAIRTIVCSLK